MNSITTEMFLNSAFLWVITFQFSASLNPKTFFSNKHLFIVFAWLWLECHAFFCLFFYIPSIFFLTFLPTSRPLPWLQFPWHLFVRQHVCPFLCGDVCACMCVLRGKLHKDLSQACLPWANECKEGRPFLEMCKHITRYKKKKRNSKSEHAPVRRGEN